MPRLHDRANIKLAPPANISPTRRASLIVWTGYDCFYNFRRLCSLCDPRVVKYDTALSKVVKVRTAYSLTHYNSDVTHTEISSLRRRLEFISASRNTVYDTAHLVNFVFSDDVIKHDPESAQQVDNLHWTQLIDRTVSRTIENTWRCETTLSLQWTTSFNLLLARKKFTAARNRECFL